MGAIASQITSLTIVFSIVYSDADQRKHQSSGSLAFVWGIRRGPVNSPHKWPATWKMFPFDDVIKSLAQWDPSIYFGFLSVLWLPAWRAYIGPAYLMALGLVEIKLKCPPQLAILTASGMDTFRQRQNGCHFAEDIFKLIFPEYKSFFLDANFTEVSYGSDWQ